MIKATQNLLILTCIIILSLNLAMSLWVRRLEPYCGAKTKGIRRCRFNDDCVYSDEYCHRRNCTCLVDYDLYANDPCNKSAAVLPSDYNTEEAFLKDEAELAAKGKRLK